MAMISVVSVHRTSDRRRLELVQSEFGSGARTTGLRCRCPRVCARACSFGCHLRRQVATYEWPLHPAAARDSWLLGWWPLRQRAWCGDPGQLRGALQLGPGPIFERFNLTFAAEGLRPLALVNFPYWLVLAELFVTCLRWRKRWTCSTGRSRRSSLSLASIGWRGELWILRLQRGLCHCRSSEGILHRVGLRGTLVIL